MSELNNKKKGRLEKSREFSTEKKNIHSVGFISLGCSKALVDTER